MAKALLIPRNDLITFTSANGNLDPDKFLIHLGKLSQLEHRLFTTDDQKLREQISSELLKQTSLP